MFKRTNVVISETATHTFDYVWCMDGRRMCKQCFNEKKQLLSSLSDYDKRNKNKKLDPAYELVAIDTVQEDEEISCDWCGEDISYEEKEDECEL